MAVGTGWSLCRLLLVTIEALPDGVPQPGAHLVTKRLEFGTREGGVARAGIHVVGEDAHGPLQRRDVLRVELHGDEDAQRVRICDGLDDAIRCGPHDSQSRGKLAQNSFRTGYAYSDKVVVLAEHGVQVVAK